MVDVTAAAAVFTAVLLVVDSQRRPVTATTIVTLMETVTVTHHDRALQAADRFGWALNKVRTKKRAALPIVTTLCTRGIEKLS